MSHEYKIFVYQTNGQKQVFTEWLKDLKDMRAKAFIRSRIKRVQMGLLGDCKSVGNGILELRIHFGPGYRVYFAFHNETIIILLCGGSKKSQQADIGRAEKYWKDFKERT